PINEDASMIYVGAAGFEANYVTMSNIDLFSLTEDFRFGPSFSATASYADPHLGFGKRFLRLVGQAAYRGAFGRDYWLAALDGAIRVRSCNRPAPSCDDDQVDLQPGESLVNRRVGLLLHNVSPPFRFGRLHLRGQMILRDRLIFPSPISFGGESTLRGY